MINRHPWKYRIRKIPGQSWRLPHYVVALLYWLVTSTVQATPTITLDKNLYDPLPLSDIVEYYQPGTQAITIDGIIALNDIHWKAGTTLPASIAMAPRQTLWYRVRINNATPYSQSLALDNTNPAADWTNVYRVDETQHPDNPEKPVETKQRVAHTEFANNKGANTPTVTLAGQSTQTLYIEVSGFHGNREPLTLYSTANYENIDQKNHWQFGLIAGSILGLMIYNLLLWQKTRDNLYFSYMLLGLFNVLTISAHHDIFVSLGTKLSQEWNTNIALVLPDTISIVLAYFVQTFFDTRKYYPKTHQCIRVYIAISLLVIFAFLIGAPMTLTTPVFFISSAITGALMLRLTIVDRTHLTIVRLLMLAGLMMPVCSGAITVMASVGVRFITRDYMVLMQLTDVMEMLLLSSAMTFRVAKLQADHKQQLANASEELITNAAQNRLLSHLNHEFRTPLNGIIGAAELLMSKNNPNNIEKFNLIYQTAQPLKILIDDLININTLSDQPRKISRIRFNLEQLLQECNDIFLPVANKNAIRSYFLIDNDLPVDVNGDPYLIRQILVNLLGNAFKFSESGLVGVHVSRNPDPGENNALYHFEVFNSGKVIPVEQREKLFHQFEKGSTTSLQHSAGLGLSIVKEISESLGGNCGYSEAISSAGNQKTQGNIFWFNIKLDAYLPIRRYTTPAFDNQNILVADPDPFMAEKIVISLTGDRHNLIHTCVSQSQINQLTQMKKIDIALIHQSLLEDDFDHTILEDVTAVIVYFDSNSSFDKTTSCFPVIEQNNSLRKFNFEISKTIESRKKINEKIQTELKSDKRYRALVVEDNPTSQIIISEILKRFPLDIDICSNGKEAEEAHTKKILSGSPYQVIFMDCEMPIRDGFTTTRLIRQFESDNRLQHTLIIALTAHNESAYKMKSLESGMDDFMSKPITIDSIRHCLQRHGLLS